MIAVHSPAPTRGRREPASLVRPAPFSHHPSLAELGRRMRQARQARSMSQSEVGRVLDVAKQTVSNWETAESPPMLINLVRFAALMNVDLAHFFTGIAEDLAPTDATLRRLDAASQLVPLYTMENAGGLLMHTIEALAPDRYVATHARHPPEAMAIVIKGPANEPRFVDGDIVTLVPTTMVEPGCMVLAMAGGRFVFRRFLPKLEGKVERAVLRALNDTYPDIEMGKGDAVLARMSEHTTTKHP